MKSSSLTFGLDLLRLDDFLSSEKRAFAELCAHLAVLEQAPYLKRATQARLAGLPAPAKRQLARRFAQVALLLFASTPPPQALKSPIAEHGN